MRKITLLLLFVLFLVMPVVAQQNPYQVTLSGTVNITSVGSAVFSDRGETRVRLEIIGAQGNFTFPDLGGDVPFSLDMTAMITRAENGGNIAGRFTLNTYNEPNGLPNILIEGGIQGFVGTGFGTADEMGLVIHLSGHRQHVQLEADFLALVEDLPWDFNGILGSSVTLTLFGQIPGRRR